MACIKRLKNSVPIAFLLVGLCFSFSSSHAQVVTQDSLALVALYNATDGPNWTNHSGWLTNPVSTWEGVTVTGSRVTRLLLNSNNLVGWIPPELGNLSNLTTLDFSWNQLTGSIPLELGNLSNLGVLTLWDNQLTGEIPSELGNLSNLTYLEFSANQLYGEIPSELGNLSNLTHLYLGGNQLTGEIPSELGNLSNLWLLALNANQLYGEIPSELGNLINLFHMTLWGNQLTGAVPEELGNLTNLEMLYLSDNPLEGTLPHRLINISNLDTFMFRGTNLCESLDPAFQAWLQGISNLASTGCTNVATEEHETLPSDYVLENNYPNPFNPRTTISFSLPQTVHINLEVHNILGELVETLENQILQPGEYSTTFEAAGLASGVYYYTLTTGDFRQTRKMVILK